MIRIHELRLPVDTTDRDIGRAVARRLGLGAVDIVAWKVWRQSIDARRRGSVMLCFTVDVEVRDEARVKGLGSDPGVQTTPDARYLQVPEGQQPLPGRPVVVGTGPAGLFAGLLLARRGYAPLVIDRGPAVDDRVRAVAHFWVTGDLDPEANVQFGEGGAGTFSDGKLGTQIHDPRCRLVIDELVAAGAPPEVATSCYPHVGTDRLRAVVRRLREAIVQAGGEVRFLCRLTDLTIDRGAVASVMLDAGERVPTGIVILALGHSARDTFDMLLARGVFMTPKPFSVGLRIEHPQALVDRAQYRELAGHPRLGPATYKLVWHGPDERSAYSFCMCPGGVVVAAASEPGGVVTNGMSVHARDGNNANSALVVGVQPGDFGSNHPLAGVAFQRCWEQAAFCLGGGSFVAPAQRVGDFVAGCASDRLGSVTASYSRGVLPCDLRGALPDFVATTLRQALLALDQRLKGFAHPDAVLTGVETRTSSPVRIVRNESCQANVSGLYPAGEGAGYAGGIVSAAVDGIRVAESVIARFAAPGRTRG